MLFAAIGAASCSAILPPTDHVLADLGSFGGLGRGLQVSRTVLGSLFFALVATLFLIRRAPQGNRAGKLAMVVALAGTFIMAAAGLHPRTTGDVARLMLADLLLTLGMAVSIWAAATLGQCFGLAPEARGLVTSGPYKLVRHPLYLGEFIGALGLLLPVLGPVTALIFAVFGLCQLARLLWEERVLATQFPEYISYRHRTPALLPWPRPRRSTCSNAQGNTKNAHWPPDSA